MGIKQWLKCGVLDKGVFEETESGTPQGGVISPLLANIALHGMIDDIVNHFPRTKRRKDGSTNWDYKPGIIRYADDFVVLHEDYDVILQCKELIAQWLEQVGLEIKPSKTRICHTLKDVKVNGKIRSRIRLPWIQHQVIPYWETPLCQNRMEEKPWIQNSNQTQQEENTSSSRGNQRGYQNQ